MSGELFYKWKFSSSFYNNSFSSRMLLDADRPRCDSNLVYMPNDRQAKEGTSLMAHFNLRGGCVIPKENARIRDMPKSELGDLERIAPFFLLDFVLTVL